MPTTAKLARPTAEPAAPKPAAAKSATTAAGKGPRPLPFFARLPYLASPVALQAKLTVNRPGDAYEQEADRVADRVLRMPAPQLQRQCSCGGTCDECAHRHTGEELQLKPLTPAGSSSIAAPSIISDVLRSPGQPLDPATRAFMEPRFGRDFNSVRVHSDTQAAASAAAVQARAYTVGNNIVFGARESASNLPLLAHELTHVVQQSGSASTLQRSSCQDFLEENPPYVREASVQDSLAADAASLGKVETELYIPLGTAAGQRTEKFRRMIRRYVGDADGRADIALLRGSTLEILEVKKASWQEDGLTFAEKQLAKYLEKAEENNDILNATWRERDGNESDTITSVKAMPMSRLSLQPNPRLIGGRPVELRWCDDGIVVFKRQTPQEEEKEKEKKDNSKDPNTTPSTLPEKLLELGKILAPALGADLLIGAALEAAAPLIALALSPLVAIAAVVLGVVYSWDKLMWLGDKIAGVAKWVFGRIGWVIQQVASVAIKLGELAVWLSKKIEWVVEELVDGIKFVAGKVVWAAHKVVDGVKWIGRGIASGARSLWDRIFGSDPEAVAPVLDLPVIEHPTHCATVAHDDAIISISSDLLFGTDKWELKPEADIPLALASARILSMLNHKDDGVMINGYTDNTGGVEYNQALSERRAQAVADWFVRSKSFPQSIIHINGHGKTEARSNDPAGRAKDRRVEIWATKHGSTETSCW